MAVGGVKITGDKELTRRLRRLPEKIQRKVLGKAVNAGSQAVFKRAKLTAPVGPTGNYLSALRKKRKTYKRTLSVVGIIGAVQSQAPHQYFIEEGTQERFRFARGESDRLRRTARFRGRSRGQRLAAALAKRGRKVSTGRMPAMRHIEKAWDATKSEAIAKFQRKLGIEIEREAAKA